MPFAAILLSRTALEIYGVIALVLVFFGLKHGYDERRRAEGRAEFASVSTACADDLTAHSPKDCAGAIRQSVKDLAQEKANNDRLQGQVATQNKRVDDFDQSAKRAKAAAAAANKQADSDALFYSERLKGLQSNLNHPSPDPNADTDRILRALAVDRRMK